MEDEKMNGYLFFNKMSGVCQGNTIHEEGLKKNHQAPQQTSALTEI
jgi:hypothetical protein